MASGVRNLIILKLNFHWSKRRNVTGRIVVERLFGEGFRRLPLVDAATRPQPDPAPLVLSRFSTLFH